jgi:autotransporter family porin
VFPLNDQLDDGWGEGLGRRELLQFQHFAKVDVTFGDDLSGVGGKAGMRVAW